MSKLDQLVVELFDEDAAAMGDDTPFAGVPGWDSLKHVELIVALESGFGIDLNTQEIERLTCKHAAREILTARQVDV
jgi:acyl carrier protein